MYYTPPNITHKRRDGVKYVFVFKYADLVYLNNYSVMYLYLIVVFGIFDQIQFQIHF